MKRKQAVGWMAAGVLVLLLWIPAQAKAAYEFYVYIEGTKQGRFKGDAIFTAKGPQDKVRQERITGVRFQYSVLSPRDVATGQASGRRTHQPIVITKPWGISSPQIFQACVTNEVLKSVLIEFWRTNPNGEGYLYQTIRLTNSTVASIRQYANVANPGEPAYPLGLEDISFTFQKIEIFNKDGNTQAMDEWSMTAR
jgi:type VI secretion system secreted protein Hcp